MMRLTFEFPTPVAAEDFAQECGRDSVRSHRVVDVQTPTPEEDRQLARRMGGKEAR